MVLKSTLYSNGARFGVTSVGRGFLVHTAFLLITELPDASIRTIPQPQPVVLEASPDDD